MAKWTVLGANIFRKVFAPACLFFAPPHSLIFYAALSLTILAGVVDVTDATKRALK